MDFITDSLLFTTISLFFTCINNDLVISPGTTASYIMLFSCYLTGMPPFHIISLLFNMDMPRHYSVAYAGLLETAGQGQGQSQQSRYQSLWQSRCQPGCATSHINTPLTYLLWPGCTTPSTLQTTLLKILQDRCSHLSSSVCPQTSVLHSA